MVKYYHYGPIFMAQFPTMSVVYLQGSDEVPKVAENAKTSLGKTVVTALGTEIPRIVFEDLFPRDSRPETKEVLKWYKKLLKENKCSIVSLEELNLN